MNLSDLQNEVSAWQARNFGSHPAWHPLLGVCEEAGELCHSFLKREQRIRGTRDEHDKKIQDAVGDILVYLADFCNQEGVSMNACLEQTWAEVKQRDWKKNNTTGQA